MTIAEQAKVEEQQLHKKIDELDRAMFCELEGRKDARLLAIMQRRQEILFQRLERVGQLADEG